jgi:ureidoglycolate lyase
MSPTPLRRLPVARLTAEAFAPFGQVIERGNRSSFAINDASSQRFTDLAQLEADADGRLALSIFQARARIAPYLLSKLERHPLGSQAFMPLNGQSFLIVVSATRPDPENPDTANLRAFVSNGEQGINFRRGVWHHPLLALSFGDFLVADRLGPGDNCKEIDIGHWHVGVDHE